MFNTCCGSHNGTYSAPLRTVKPGPRSAWNRIKHSATTKSEKVEVSAQEGNYQPHHSNIKYHMHFTNHGDNSAMNVKYVKWSILLFQHSASYFFGAMFSLGMIAFFVLPILWRVDPERWLGNSQYGSGVGAGDAGIITWGSGASQFATRGRRGKSGEKYFLPWWNFE